jgi:hypothetical protein
MVFDLVARPRMRRLVDLTIHFGGLTLSILGGEAGINGAEKG